MKIILQGKDWSEIKPIDERMQVAQFREEKIEEEAKENQEVSVSGVPNDSEIIINNVEGNEKQKENPEYSIDYFDRFFSLFGHEPSAFNLGLYQTSEKDKEVLKSTKYVGIVPLLKKNKRDKVKNNKAEMPIVKISSRFGISPADMISAVLSGDDYYENPDMLKTKSYMESEWRQLASKMDEDKVLFGLINGIGYIDLFGDTKGRDTASKTDVGIVDAYGVFEIIDFVNKAKEVCKKKLKRQSQRVEENLDCKVKGRILIQKQIKYNISKGQNQKTYCSYNKMSDDIKENQIIKYALHLCQKNHGIGDSLVEDIRFCMNTLNGVPLKKCSSSDFVGLKNNGAFRQYKDALNAAKKVIGRYSLSYSNQKNNDGSQEPNVQLSSGKILPYFIDMNLLFEYYCRAIFKKAIAEINLEKKDKNKISFELESTKDAKRILFRVSQDYWNKHVISGSENDENDEELKLHRFFMPQYIPDIVITYKMGKDDSSRVVAVFDAKYSDVEKKEKRSRTHQVLFYMKALGCNYGGLISPYMKKQDEEQVNIISGNVAVNHNVSRGNPENDKNSNIKLFYLPLISDNTTDRNMFNEYVKLAKNCLEEISTGLETKLKQEQIGRELRNMMTEIDSLKNSFTKGQKEEKSKFIDALKSLIEQIKM